MLKVTTKGIPELRRYLDGLMRGVKIHAVRAFMEYLIGDQTHGLKHYPVYNYITREQAYGQTFVADRQRRWFFAALKDGKIGEPGYPHRTGELQRGWEYKELNSNWTQATIENQVPYSGYVMGNVGQARLNSMAGWRNVMTVIADNFRGAIRHAQAAVNAYLRNK